MRLKRHQHATASATLVAIAVLSFAPLHAAAKSPARAASPSVPALREDAYILGGGDQLELKIFDAPELSGNLDVLNDGTVALPLIGSVRVTGLTLSQAQGWFTSLLKQQLQRPQLLLRVVRPRPIRVALVGEVVRPGIYSLTTSEASQTEGSSVTLSGLPTVVDAIQKAGGITINADLTRVQLQRRLPSDQPVYKRTILDLVALVREGDQVQNPFLFDGDTLRIAKAEQPVQEVVELSSANLSPQTIAVNVIGQVVKPGRLEVPSGLPLVQAVLAAGGVVPGRANTSHVELVRINRNGTATRRTFKLNFSQGASNAENPPLRDGDTVLVNRNGLAVASDGIASVTTPLTGLASVLSLVQLVSR
ncbi:MAG: sugar transporter [Cyanobacteria bacterium K_Offshore_0m_m2_072]|nr:sugar transporter [Cyanobacteria bacterium K_Offshore_0m_m2_072]